MVAMPIGNHRVGSKRVYIGFPRVLDLDFRFCILDFLFRVAAKMQSDISSFLPLTFEHDIESSELTDKNNWNAIIHTECDSLEACDKWISEFSSKSLSTWRVRKTYPNPLRGLVYRKDYICQHSSFNKKHPKRCHTKDTGCSAKLSIKVYCFICVMYCILSLIYMLRHVVI